MKRAFLDSIVKDNTFIGENMIGSILWINEAGTGAVKAYLATEVEGAEAILIGLQDKEIMGVTPALFESGVLNLVGIKIPTVESAVSGALDDVKKAILDGLDALKNIEGNEKIKPFFNVAREGKKFVKGNAEEVFHKVKTLIEEAKDQTPTEEDLANAEKIADTGKVSENREDVAKQLKSVAVKARKTLSKKSLEMLRSTSKASEALADKLEEKENTK